MLGEIQSVDFSLLIHTNSSADDIADLEDDKCADNGNSPGRYGRDELVNDLPSVAIDESTLAFGNRGVDRAGAGHELSAAVDLRAQRADVTLALLVKEIALQVARGALGVRRARACYPRGALGNVTASDAGRAV